ncbi:tubulin-tyrosine ligase family-domain-containing protein [Cantharellus anzutake]|uniref:tubulin-tyrosine ligase family-domain-containing protein n=1 Tax=Cantharellus anzutake TaxID=1750568 RepID=UPI001908A49F|nr:tubulin-tyrosine ligase family-domain-containing protein [Cantharellus anzutake]KAF8324563.1 tubulin-tyrosine ligase family-domain-containing protein [Cantharellus anzutake]
MGGFHAWCSFPAAPFAQKLILNALKENFPMVTISSSDTIPSDYRTTSSDSCRSPFLQWCTYDSLDHELTLRDPVSTLASSYTIRKSLTWAIDISFVDELDEMWSDELWELGEILDQNDSSLEMSDRKWFILKPSMSERGVGIRLFSSKEALQRIFWDFDSESSDEETGRTIDGISKRVPDGGDKIIASQLRHFVIQEYLDKPLLMDPTEANALRDSPLPRHHRPTKFHLRVYCVASGALTLFVDENILVLFAGSPYELPSSPNGEQDVDLKAHLTNTSWQKVTSENPDPNRNVRTLQEMIGCRILSGPPSNSFEHSCLSEENVQDIIDQVCEILADVFRAALETSVHFQPLPNAFELFGADLLVTHNLSENGKTRSPFSVSILELNAEPAIEMTGARLSWILEHLFFGICQTCVAPFIDRSSRKKMTWRIGETMHGLRKCLEVEIRGTKGW